MSFVEFRNFANQCLNILKEEKTSQYEEYIMRNFGRLQESVSRDDLYKIAKCSDLEKDNLTFTKDVTYRGNKYDYFIYDGRSCVGVDKNGKIVYIGDFYKNSLSDGVIVESKLKRVRK